MSMKIRIPAIIAFVVGTSTFGGCGNENSSIDDDITVVRGALEPCVPGTPVIVETREETPGPVAPGISKVYFVVVRNTDSATCGPASVTFTPDSFHFFSTVVQPSTVGGVGPGSTVQFRLVVTSDPSVGATTTVIGFTIIKNSSATATTRGSVTYVTQAQIVDLMSKLTCSQLMRTSAYQRSSGCRPAGSILNRVFTVSAAPQHISDLGSVHRYVLIPGLRGPAEQKVTTTFSNS